MYYILYADECLCHLQILKAHVISPFVELCLNSILLGKTITRSFVFSIYWMKRVVTPKHIVHSKVQLCFVYCVDLCDRSKAYYIVL